MGACGLASASGLSLWWLPAIVIGFIIFKIILKIYIKDGIKKLRKKEKKVEKRQRFNARINAMRPTYNRPCATQKGIV